jgi:sporadic carbohydrate cluster protein (TIGR04323 family)
VTSNREGYRGYVSSRDFGGLRIPVPVQALVLRDWCQRHGKIYKLHLNENSFPHSYMVLEGMVRNLDGLEGMLMVSMFMLPERRERRRALYDRVLAQGVDLRFVMEDMAIARPADIEPVEEILSIHHALTPPPGRRYRGRRHRRRDRPAGPEAPMRVLVTGAGGFVGKVVARTLAAAGHQTTASFRKTEPADLAEVAGIALLRLDLQALDRLEPLEAVVHCAADVPAFCPDPDALYRSNVEGARRLFDAAVAAGATRIVYLSSMSIYGAISAPVVTEDTPSTDPEVYGRSKLEGERLLATACARGPRLAGLSIRLPGVVGRGGRNNFLSSTLQRVLKGEPVSANHAAAPFNNIVHVEDLAGFIADRLGDLPPGHRVTNIAGARPGADRRGHRAALRHCRTPRHVPMG